jgi:hypothetical protein
MELIKHVTESIEKAEKLESKLTGDVLKLPGYSGLKVKHFLNNLLTERKLNYLEVGVFRGSTFCSALYNNTQNAYAIDNWSEFGNYRNEFHENTRKYVDLDFVQIIEEDCFSVDLKQFKHKIDVFFYDGNHSAESQEKALTYFYPVLKKNFIYIGDDYNWSDVRKGCQSGIEKTNVTKLFEKEIFTREKNNHPLRTYGESFGWWNGLGIFVLNKGS